MDESRKARQPKKPDNNELWSWIVIALLFAFAWGSCHPDAYPE